MTMSDVVEIFAGEAEELLDPDARLEHLAGGFSWAEGPVWNFEGGYLTFSDVIGNAMHRYAAADGVQTYRQPSNHANGQTRHPGGALVVCEHQTRRVTRETPDGVEVLAERYEDQRFNSPNDVVAAGDGSFIFTDPSYGLDKEEEGGGGERELPFQGVYRIPPGEAFGGAPGEARLLADDFVGPNGLALTPEGDRLYVADSERSHVRTFSIGAGWEVSGGEVLVEIPSGSGGVPDGMKLDGRGNLYCTGDGGVWVCSPEGEVLGRIRVPETTANLAWGDDDGRTLYLTADTGLYRIRCRATGYAPHRPVGPST